MEKDVKKYRVRVSFQADVDGDNEHDAVIHAAHAIAPHNLTWMDNIKDVTIHSNGQVRQNPKPHLMPDAPALAGQDEQEKIAPEHNRHEAF